MTFQISLVHQFEQQQHETWELAFSPNGQRLVSSDGENSLLIPASQRSSHASSEVAARRSGPFIP